VTVDTSNGLQVYLNETNPTPKEFVHYTVVNYYYPIEMSTETAVNATLRYRLTTTQLTSGRYAYDESQIAEKKIVESTLTWAFYNVTAGAWQVDSGASVDVDANVVIQETSHFSTWAVYGQTSAASDVKRNLVSLLMVLVASVALLL
jgi:hypothetical protein